MMTKYIAAILMTMLVAASGAAGSFYLASAQEQAAPGQAEVTLSDAEVQPGAEVGVSGSNFAADSGISIYLMSAAQTRLANGSALVLQEIPENQSEAASPEGGNFFGDALNALQDLFGMNGSQEDTGNQDGNATQGNLLVVLDPGLDNGTVSLECGDQSLAEGELDGTNLVSLAAESGTYDECSISLTGGNVTDGGEIGSLTITSDPEEGYEESLAGSATADDQGSFNASVTAPDAEGDYAVLAVGDDGAAAASELSVIPQPEAETTGNVTGAETTDNVTGGAMNETAPVPDDNATAAQNQTLDNQTAPVPEGNLTAGQNQTEGNQTATTEEATVQVEEQDAEPGEPLAISGDGFEPGVPVQIFINNVQITNVITNIEGSFNTVVIVPTTVGAGSAEVVVQTEQTNVVESVSIVEPDGQSQGPATLRFTAVSATDNATALEGAPVTIFDASSGQLVDSDETPLEVELEAGTYSVFYSDFDNFEFESAEPGSWTDTANGGSGLITVREGRNATVTAIYSERPSPPPPPSETVNSLTLRAEDTDGEPLPGMFVTVYDANTGDKIEQGFTELAIEDLPPGTYPIFYANFEELVFVSASPGSWVQTPFGGAGLVTIPDDGENHNMVVTAVYDRVTEAAEEQFNIQAPLDIRGDIFTITSNETRPEGPFVMSGSFALVVEEEDPVDARLSAYIMSAREDSNENVELDSQRSRDHDTFQIVDFEPRVARPVGPNSYLVSGNADLLLNGDMYSENERVEVMVRGGDVLTPTNVEIEFQGDHRYSAANRLETLFGSVTSGFQ